MISYTETLPSGFFFDMLCVEGGTFQMGGNDAAASDSEKPVHKVKIPTFYLGKYPVTQGLWKAVMGKSNSRSKYKNELHPVDNVSWEGAKGFIKKLNKITELKRRNSGFGAYRLPTESEWEFAARGGVRSEGFLFAGSDKIDEVGWYNKNSYDQIHEVGLLMTNELGFYDLSGNVWEWVEDHWDEDYEGASYEGYAWIDNGRNPFRVFRGGGYSAKDKDCRVSYRYRGVPYVAFDAIGFRLALSLSPEEDSKAFIKR